ncbi:MAG TPA: serine hydrolase domain-containing protein [Stellaceae bacterium]|nr:serine hydrolase domain-containing protein [Stellaceae bacterium]
MRRATACLIALFLTVSPFCRTARAADVTVKARLQHLLDDYVAQRSEAESISGAALRADIGTRRRIVAVFSGTDGLADKKPIGPETLFQIGSNTKHFTAALMLKLEAMGKLDIHQTVGRWLPQYRAWRDTTIQSLLSMTSAVPNYSETEEIGEIVSADLNHQFTPKRLIAAVDPDGGKHLPSPSGWFYSNTNDILAGLIVEAASGMSYKAALETLILKPLGLRDTFYSDGSYPPAVLKRVPRGLYENRDCLLYQPAPCTRSTLAPLIGQDMRTQNLSWAGAAGGMISTPRDLDRWVRDLFSLRVFPRKQLDEMTAIVSEKTGSAIPEVSAADPAGFGLNLARMYAPEPGGTLWFYQGTTLGFRAIFAYWPQHDLVITAVTNSQPPDGEDQFGKTVVNGALRILDDAGWLRAR